MRVIPIDQGLPSYPLPADFDELTREGQRKARVNGCRQWLHRWSTAEQLAYAYVSSIRFWDLWYLHPDPENDFDPMFYDMDPLPAPPGHYDVYRQWALNRLCLGIAPRGWAKSFSVRKSISMETVTALRYSTVYATSSGDNTKNTGQALKDQFTHNQRINDDFGPECVGGRLVPRRGEAPFGGLHMQLNNGSWVRCISAESKQRGLRPRLYVLDDPEFDPKAATSMQLVREYMETLLFKMVLPMVMRRGCGCRWLATFVSRRHYAWHAMDVDAEGRAKDPRFNNWDRIIIRAEYQDAEGRTRSCWPEMWPATTRERLELAREDRHYEQVMSLEEVKQAIGLPNYLSEYMARPGEGDEVFFPHLDEERHGYWFEGMDNLLESEPWHSETMICWYRKNPDAEGFVVVRKPLSVFIREGRCFSTVDTSYTATPDSDSKVSTLMCITPENELFVLDMWSRQCQQHLLITECLQQADRWRCPTIHVEAIRDGLSVFQDLESIVMSRASEMAGVVHLPGVRKFNPGQTEKTAKISALLRRFDYGKIKMPLRRRNEHPWRNLFNQIEEFNPNAADGGLQHDDELDTVSMSMFVVRGRVSRFIEKEDKVRSPLDCLRDGEYTDEHGTPNVLKLLANPGTHSLREVMEVLDMQGTPQESQRATRV